MPASLPPHPNLEWLRKAAKRRLVELRATRPGARLAEAQLGLAREYGFSSWRKIKAHIEQMAAHSQATDSEATIAGFLEWVGSGRIDEVRAALDSAPQLVNAIGSHPFWGGRPQALHVAIETKRRDLFDLLLERGADVNGSNEQYAHWSPLMLAINRDQAYMQQQLLTRGARIGLLEALMLADNARVEELLRTGKLPDSAADAGPILGFARTPFAIDRLMALGAPTDIKDQWGSRPIDAISRLGPAARPLVQHMIARGVTAQPKEYARLGDLEMLETLVAADPEVARLDSVMMAAVDSGHHEMVQWLLAHGANVNARADAESRHTALHSAAWNGDLKLVKLLIEAGADPTARDEQYDAPAIGWADTSIVVSNNPRCAEVVAYLAALSSD